MPAPAAAPAIPPGPPRLRLDDKVLSLEFRLLDAQFNEPGRYQLVLRVENPLLDDSVKGVTLSINHGDIVHSNQAESDTAEQTDLTDTINFEKDTFLFILPQGLCKNDKHHDVRLCIDVLKFGGNFPNKGRMVGQAIFAIYPRTNQPRINLRAGPFQPLYNYQGILALLRVGSNQMAMHCGRLAYNVCFKEYRPPTPEEISKHVSPRPGNARSGTSLETTPRHDPHHLSTPKPASPAPPTFRTPIPQSSTPRSVSYQGESSKIDTLHASYPSRTHQVSDAQDLQTTLEEEDRLSPDTDSLQDQHDLTDRSDESPAPVLLVSSRLPDDVPLLLPSPPKTPSPIKKSHVTDKPPAQSDPVHGSDGESSFLPSPGTEKIIVTLHSATHLPTTTAGSAPSPFVTLMSSSDEMNGAKAQSISHAKSPTHNPAWGETLTMTVKEDEVEQEDLILTLADSRSLDALVTYRMPVRVLQPFHTYHLNMVQSGDQVPVGCSLNVSIQRRSSFLSQQDGFTYSALQVLLLGVETPLQGLAHPLLAVARIVPNYTVYSKSLKPPAVCGVPHVTLTFPDLALSSFQVPPTASEGHPQISSIGLPVSQPVWNSLYLFQGRDGVTLFSEGAALVLEYYMVTNDSMRMPWNLSGYCGFSVIPLDMLVYHQLISNSHSKASTINGVTIQGTDLTTVSGEPPSVALQLLLLRSEVKQRPEFFLSPLDAKSQVERQSQRIHSDNPTQGRTAALNHEELQRDGTSFPPYNALADILPNPWTQPIPTDPKPADPGGHQGHVHADPSSNYLSTKDMELPADGVMEHQEQEVANYRLAMQRMADDIITLRRQMGGLEAENSALRSERSLLQDVGRSMLSDGDIDVMTKAEIADRLVTLKQRLASETSELRGMRDRVQQLQNELVRRNDREKELLILQRAHQQQQAVLQQYHQRANRAKALQDTVRKQEKVIEKMEKLLDNKLREEKKRGRVEGGERGGRVDILQGEVYATLMAENTRLREELEKARQPVITVQPNVPSQGVFSASEKFSLLSKLEKSQARVQSLERELEEAARRWGREKQELLTRLSEQEMGFSRTHTTILHHFPTKEPDVSSRRPTKLDPLI